MFLTVENFWDRLSLRRTGSVSESEFYIPSDILIKLIKAKPHTVMGAPGRYTTSYGIAVFKDLSYWEDKVYELPIERLGKVGTPRRLRMVLFAISMALTRYVKKLLNKTLFFPMTVGEIEINGESLAGNYQKTEFEPNELDELFGAEVESIKVGSDGPDAVVQYFSQGWGIPWPPV